MRELFVTRFDVVTQYGAIAGPRFTVGVKLYYRMLELLLNSVRVCHFYVKNYTLIFVC